jgi:glucokinase
VTDTALLTFFWFLSVFASGLTPKNIHHIEGIDSKFMQAYVDKGRVVTLLDTIPTFAVMTEDLGVRGAYKCAMMVRPVQERAMGAGLNECAG